VPAANHNLPTFSPIDKSSTPKQSRVLPHEGDPFCGNENNRRAAQRRAKAKAAIDTKPADNKPASGDVKGDKAKAVADAPVATDATASDGQADDASEGGQAPEPTPQPNAPAWRPRA